MKKVLALVLAVMMMATVAFAAGADLSGNAVGDTAATPKNILPGGKLKFNDSGLAIKGYTTDGALNSTNYAKPKAKWEDGGKWVESVAFDDANDQVVIKIKQDYTLTTEKKLKGTITLKGKRVNKKTYPDLEVGIDATIGYVLADGKVNTPVIQIDANGDADIDNSKDPTVTKAFDDDDNDKYLWKVVKGTDADGEDVTYGTLDFEAADDDVEIEVRVYDGDKLYLYNDVSADSAILKAYADTDAEISFLNFNGTPTFNATATVRFYKDEDSYIYGVKDGKLTNVNAKWDDDEGCFILKTRTLGSYVFSDKKLNVAATTPANPDTGANDVVGIASALAAVALVSAAAVSLKK